MTMTLIDRRKDKDTLLSVMRKILRNDFDASVSKVAAAVVAGVATVAGGVMSSNAAKSAANTQAGASAAAEQTQLKMFQEQAALQAPWRAAGIQGLDQLTSLTSPYSNFFPSIGSGAVPNAAGAPGTNKQTPQIYNPNVGGIPGLQSQNTPYNPANFWPNSGGAKSPGTNAATSPMGNYTGNTVGGNASGRGAAVAPGFSNTQPVAPGMATTQQVRPTTGPVQQPGISVQPNAGSGKGYTAAPAAAPGTQGANGVINPFSYDPSKVSQDPAYKYELSQALQGVNASAAAKGGGLAPSTTKALIGAAEGEAAKYEAQDFGQALSTYNTNFSDTMESKGFMLGALQSLSGVGQSATNTLSNAAGTTATNVGNLQVGAGNAQAAGIVGSANAWTGAIDNGLKSYTAFGGGF